MRCSQRHGGQEIAHLRRHVPAADHDTARWPQMRPIAVGNLIETFLPGCTPFDSAQPGGRACRANAFSALAFQRWMARRCRRWT